MRPVINFNYDLGAGRDEINDVLSDWKLTTEGNAQLLAGNEGPKNALVLREIVPEIVHTLTEQHLVRE